VADLIDATAAAQRRTALRQMDRGLSHRIDRLRDQVLELEALTSYDIDFPEEDSGPVSPERITAAAATLTGSLETALGTAGEGERLREGALAVIAGRPNAGKSSLFNALLGSERAIVTEIPGTTRDAIEAPAVCDGFPFRLVDTAGLRDSPDRIERLGIEVSRKYLDAADLIVFCAEAGRNLSPQEELALSSLRAPVVLARTKADVAQARSSPRTELREILVSARTGDGLAALRTELARAAFSSLAAQGDVEPVVTRARHRGLLARALEEVRAFTAARAAGLEGAVAATHLRGAVTALEEIIGVVAPDDVLGRIFATFCVGK
jgi:tRNA modification GTPase